MNRTMTALVTGATSGIGRAIAEVLLANDFTVYGIGRNADGAPKHGNFHYLAVNLADSASVAGLPDLLPSTVDLLVNAAGVAYYGPHETVSPAAIHEMVAVNLEAPMILTSLLLPMLKEVKGTIVNISSVTAKHYNNTHGCAYGATKAGLTSFADSLFEECRKTGVRVITIHPDLTDTGLYRNADFTPVPDSDFSLTAQEIADFTWRLLSARDGLVVTDFTVRPQRNGIQRKDRSDSRR